MRARNQLGVAGKGSLNVQAYVDVRKMATIATFLSGAGYLTAPQYGQIVQFCINQFIDILEEYHPDRLVRYDTLSEALQWLGDNGFSLAQFSVNGNRRLIKDVQAEALAMDFGQGMPQTVLKSSVPLAPKQTFSTSELEAVAKQLYRECGTVLAGYEYLFTPNYVGPDTSEVLPTTSTLPPPTTDQIQEKNWQNAKSMAGLIIDGFKTQDSPECLPFTSLLDDAINAVLNDRAIAKQQKEEMEKIRVKAALLAGPVGNVVE